VGGQDNLVTVGALLASNLHSSNNQVSSNLSLQALDNLSNLDSSSLSRLVILRKRKRLGLDNLSNLGSSNLSRLDSSKLPNSSHSSRASNSLSSNMDKLHSNNNSRLGLHLCLRFLHSIYNLPLQLQLRSRRLPASVRWRLRFKARRL
jgi:hypothetical protein